MFYFPGCFNENSPAAVELHVTYDVLKGLPDAVSLTEDTAPERDYLPSPAYLSGCLFMADTGYFSKAYMPQPQNACAHFIMRMSNTINPSGLHQNPADEAAENMVKSITQCWRVRFGKNSDKYEKIFTATENRINELIKSIDNINNAVAKEIDQAQALYVEALSDVQEKQGQINGILGHVSGRAIAGDFEKSAEQEKSMADTLRIVSLVLMLFIVMIVGYSFWATVSTEFKWENSLFRVFCDDTVSPCSVPRSRICKT